MASAINIRAIGHEKGTKIMERGNVIREDDLKKKKVADTWELPPDIPIHECSRLRRGGGC